MVNPPEWFEDRLKIGPDNSIIRLNKKTISPADDLYFKRLIESGDSQHASDFIPLSR
jgi:hypothetical protein